MQWVVMKQEDASEDEARSSWDGRAYRNAFETEKNQWQTVQHGGGWSGRQANQKKRMGPDDSEHRGRSMTRQSSREPAPGRKRLDLKPNREAQATH